MSKKSEEEVAHNNNNDDAPAGDEEGATPAEQEATAPPPAEELLDDRMRLALEAAADKKAFDVVVLDLRAVANFTDCFIITSGGNTRQVQAIADAVEESLKRGGTRPARIEGYKAAEWVLIDYGDFIVHVFENKARQFYDLERLWRDAARVEVPPAAVDGATRPAAGGENVTAAAGGGGGVNQSDEV